MHHRVRVACGRGVADGHASRLAKLSRAALARINRITSSEAGEGSTALMRGDPTMLGMLREHVDTVYASCQAVWTLLLFLQHNEQHWAALHRDEQRVVIEKLLVPFPEAAGAAD